MNDYGRRMVIDLGCEGAVAHTAQAMRGHILSSAELMGRYRRP